MTEHKPEVVEQVDRIAAADWLDSWFSLGGTTPTSTAIRNSERDDHTLVQAFARHRIPALTPAQPATPALMDEVREALTGMLNHYWRNVCTHEDTHRGGVLWTICDSCGAKWADDEGGFESFEEPGEITRAQDLLAKLPPKAMNEGGEG